MQLPTPITQEKFISTLETIVRKKSAKRNKVAERWLSEKEMKDELKWSTLLGWTFDKCDILCEHGCEQKLSCWYRSCTGIYIYIPSVCLAIPGPGSMEPRKHAKPRKRPTWGLYDVDGFVGFVIELTATSRNQPLLNHHIYTIMYITTQPPGGATNTTASRSST